MMRESLVVLAAVIGCSREPPAPTWERSYEAAVTALQGSDPTRRAASREIVATCCQLDPTISVDLRSRACDEMIRIVRTDRSLVGEVWFAAPPSCTVRLPVDTLFALCEDGCSAELTSTIVYTLGELEPTPAIVEELWQYLLRSVDGTQPGAIADTAERDQQLRTPQEQVRETVARTIAKLGEDDLSPIVLALSHPQPDVRKLAILSLHKAVQHGPLDMPSALVALEHAANDEWTVAVAAPAAALYRARMHEREEVAAVRVIKSVFHFETLRPSLNQGLWDAMRLLAVRRFSCRAENAREYLEALAENADDEVAMAAKRALELRARRCAGSEP